MARNDRGLAFFARALMALIFVISGTRKVIAFAMTVGYFDQLGIPMPTVVAVVTIVIEIGGGLLLVTGYRQTIVASVMAAFTLGTALIAHQFWTVADPQAFGGQLNHFLKNVAMVGGFLMIAIDGRRTGR